MLVSIIMPCYNAQKYIAQSIRSVLNQSYTNWELLIVDDCSKDDSLEVIQPFLADSRVKLFRNAVNGGAVKARNTGIEQAKGTIIAFLDSDDTWYPDKLEKQVTTYKSQPGTAIVFANYEMMDENGVLLNKVLEFKPVLDYSALLKSNSIGCLTATYNVSLLGKRYFSQYGHEDYVLWLSILKEGYNALNAGACLACYRKSANSLSSNKIKAAGWQWNIYRKVEKLGLFPSMYYFIWYTYLALKKHK